MLFTWGIDKLWYILTMEYYSAIKRTTDTYKNMNEFDESQLCYTKGKKPDTKGYILHVYGCQGLGLRD